MRSYHFPAEDEKAAEMYLTPELIAHILSYLRNYLNVRRFTRLRLFTSLRNASIVLLLISAP
jgi:hypothetical protein